MVPVEEQPLLDSGDVILYRGVHESDVFRFLQVDRHNLDQEKRDVWQKYIKTQEQMLSDSILSFNTIHDRAKRCETSHILDGTWISDKIAEANGLDIEGDGFAAELWQAAHQSFTLVSWMAKNKFGPHFVKCRTPIGNLRLTTFFANEHEVRIIDPDLSRFRTPASPGHWWKP